jgi:transcription initiation factor IIE alpha subunit
MPPTLTQKAFLTLLRAKMLETQVEISVLRQEYADKLGKIESKLGKILQATELYEESSQDNNFLTPHSTLCMTFDEDKQPLVKSLKFESELTFKCHLNQRLDTSVLDKHLTDFFPRWSQIRKLIQRAIAFKKNKHDDDDDFSRR